MLTREKGGGGFGAKSGARSGSLHERADQLALAQEAIGIVTWVWEVEIDRVRWYGDLGVLLGFSPRQFSGSFQDYLRAVHPDDRAMARHIYTECVKGRRPQYRSEERVIWPDESVHWLETYGRGSYGADGRCVRVVGVVRDITELKCGEEMLDRTRSRLELALAASQVCTWDFNLPSGEVVLSEAWAEILGARPGETRTTFKALAKLVHPDEFEPLRRTVAEVVKGLRTEYTVEYRVRHQNGEWRWIVSRGKVVKRDGRGRAIRMVGTNLDITDRRHVEEELRRFRLAMDTSIDSIYLIDLTTMRFVDVNDAACRQLGYTREQLLKLGPQDVLVTDREQLRREYDEVIASGERGTSAEARYVTSDGRRRWTELHRRALRSDNGWLIVTLGRDITDRKFAEAALHESEARFRSLTELSSDWYWEQDVDFRFTKLSGPGASANASSGDPSIYIGKARWEITDLEPVEGDWEAHRAQLERHESFRDAVFRRRMADGTIRYMSVSGEPIIDEQGRFTGYRGVGSNISERKRTENQLRESEARKSAILNASIDAIITMDSEGRIVEFNPAAENCFGLPRERAIGRSMAELIVPPELRERHREGLQRYLATGEGRVLGRRLEMPALRADGSRFQAELAIIRIHGSDPALFTGTLRDITERKRAEEQLRKSEARFRSLTELSSDWYWEQDQELRFTYLSPGFSERTDSDPGKVLGRRRWEFDDVVPGSGTWPEHRAVLEARLPFRDFEQIRVCEDGTRQFFTSSGAPVFDKTGNFKGYRGVSSNITVRKSAEKRLAYLAQFDAVTGLANRHLLQEKLEHAIVQSRRRNRGAGVLFVDLDRFKLVNDALGHRVGDALLSQVGRSLRDCVRQDDTVGRLAGDEFAVVIADLARPEDAAIVAQKILDSFAAPFDLEGQDIYLTASIGLAAFPGDGEDADTLLKCADAAMYRAKESSRNAFRFYTGEMNARTTARLQLNTDLRRAVERHEFLLHYQPKVNLVTGAMIGMEALLRWQHPQRGIVAPMEFIPALEDSGLILAVGDWVIEEACRQLRDWTREGLEPVPIAVNLSVRQFRRHDLDAVFRDIIARHGLRVGLIELEITESSLMEDPKDAIRQLHALRAAGLRISVDDFGTGYSSLAYLTRLPLSTLKIDRAFVNAAISDPSSATIVRMVIDMAQNLGFNVVAEGIETDQHVAFLRQHGCEQGQGYHFGKPVPAAEIAHRLRRST